MAQTRLYVQGDLANMSALYQALDLAFEDDGLPLAFVEIDEDRNVHEVSLYVDGDYVEAEERMAAHVADGFRVEREALADIDWVTRSLQGLQPVRAGRFLVHGSHDRPRIRVGDLAIEIEAGLAFGTGHHGTTAGCLEMISSIVRRKRPRNALDLGTGSAVLAIGIAKLARIPVLATDIDPVATDVARQNAQLNGVGRYINAATATGFNHRSFALAAPFDLIVANILARPLAKLAPDMARAVSSGGSIVLSGILDRQRNAVVAAFVAQRFRHVATTHREGWSTIHMAR